MYRSQWQALCIHTVDKNNFNKLITECYTSNIYSSLSLILLIPPSLLLLLSSSSSSFPPPPPSLPPSLPPFPPSSPAPLSPPFVSLLPPHLLFRQIEGVSYRGRVMVQVDMDLGTLPTNKHQDIKSSDQLRIKVRTSFNGSSITSVSSV